MNKPDALRVDRERELLKYLPWNLANDLSHIFEQDDRDGLEARTPAQKAKIAKALEHLNSNR